MRKPPGTETRSSRTVKILSVSPTDADHAALCRILREPRTQEETNCRWKVCAIRTAASTAKALAKEEVPIVISESDLLPGTWRTILQIVSLLPDPPLLIVASRMADERLWAEALNLGAWDVLAKPFDTGEVIRIVASAWRHWQDRRGLGTKWKAAASGA